MSGFEIKKEETFINKIFKPIPWFYHLSFLVFGVIVSLLFQIFYIQKWTSPFYLIFIIGIIIIYCVTFLIVSPLIKKRWFIKKKNIY
ncbi:TIGR04570 family membrane protein [Spiroplasma endosymbiont of Anurida maritima]|uniref:TIGR04570 family membrane protein n=1 Tax=Spiroplasma endosymbiont of Anurida maritima TaxID=2967972 RepID=UPI0036D24F68